MSPQRFYMGVFLIASCTLMLQVIQTRILSVVSWYHLAFFSISMAMFGLTTGAVWVYLRRERFTERTLSYDLGYFSAGFAVTTCLSLATQMTLVPVSPTTVTALWTWLELSVVLAVPFHFAGVVISLALTRSPFPVGRTYAADMQGAGLGCLGVLVLLSKTDAPSAVIWVGVIGAIAAWSFAGSGVGTVSGEALPFDWLLKRRKSIIGLLVLAAIANGVSDRGLQPTSTNSKLEQPASYLFREWNSLSRIAVHKELFAPPFLWGAPPRCRPIGM